MSWLSDNKIYLAESISVDRYYQTITDIDIEIYDDYDFVMFFDKKKYVVLKDRYSWQNSNDNTKILLIKSMNEKLDDLMLLYKMEMSK